MPSSSSVIVFDRYALAEVAMTPLFSGLSEGDLRAVLADAWIEMQQEGHELFAKDEQTERFYILLDGHVELYIDENGRHSVLEIANAPCALGEAALFGNGLYVTSARIIGHAKLLVVPAASFLKALEGRFDLALRMLGSMSRRLRGLIGQIAQLKMKSTAQRLASFLLGLTGETEGSVSLRFPYDKHLVAESLGMSAETLSRALQALVAAGVESHPDNKVMIADLSVLRQFCSEKREGP